MYYEKEKDIIINMLAHSAPVIADMTKKNWRRYSLLADYLEKHLTINKGEKILDYGCGHLIVSKLLELLGYQVSPFEPYASEDHYLTAELLGLKDVFKKKLEPDEKFQNVIMSEVVEHLSIPRTTMEQVNHLTAMDGYLIITTPNVLRYELWLKYILRRTGHPQPIEIFASSDNNYVNHQREYTLKELSYLIKYYGYNIIKYDIIDTRPSREVLDEYRMSVYKYTNGIVRTNEKSWLNTAKKHFFSATKHLWPNSFLNNSIFLIAKKMRDV